MEIAALCAVYNGVFRVACAESNTQTTFQRRIFPDTSEAFSQLFFLQLHTGRSRRRPKHGSSTRRCGKAKKTRGWSFSARHGSALWGGLRWGRTVSSKGRSRRAESSAVGGKASELQAAQCESVKRKGQCDCGKNRLRDQLLTPLRAGATLALRLLRSTDLRSCHASVNSSTSFVRRYSGIPLCPQGNELFLVHGEAPRSTTDTIFKTCGYGS